MVWQAYSVDTITGGDVTPIPMAAFRWARLLSLGAKGSITVPLEATTDVAELKALTALWARTIVLEQDGAVVYAGICVGRRANGATLDVELTDLWGLWARRGAWESSQVSPGVDRDVELWEETYTGLSLGTLVKRAVQRGTIGYPVPEMGLPLTLPADEAGIHSATYYGYHLDVVADVIDDLVLRGVEVDFRPRWLSGSLDWELLTDPTPTVHEWDVTAADGGVAEFNAEDDGLRMSNNVHVVGQGMGRAMLVESSRNPGSSLPLLDRIDPRKMITTLDELLSMAQNGLVEFQQATDSWWFQVLAHGSPKISEVKPGDTARLTFSGHNWIDDGTYDRVITRIEGTLNESVRITCQPTGGA